MDTRAEVNEASPSMLVRFEALGNSQQRAAFLVQKQCAIQFWALFVERGWRASESYCLEQFPGLESFRGAQANEVVFVATERAALPLAELLVEHCPDSIVASVGRASVSHQQALREAFKQTQVDLQTSRVRAGFTRGHLLEVVLHVPFDVSGDDEALQVAAEVYLETRLGDSFMDKWIANVSISRIARTRGLLVVSDAVDQAEHYALEQTLEIIQGAALAVTSELPLTKLSLASLENSWIALEIPPFESSVSSESFSFLRERTFASSIEPEALKAALEGMPFDSSRFTQGHELFVWCTWQAPVHLEDRIRVRQEVEEALSSAGGVSLAGTGFGPGCDFVDLWLVPELETLERIGRVLCERAGVVQLGFYDSSLSGELLEFRKDK